MNTIIYILGGGMKKDKKGNWHTTYYDGDRMRVIAGAYLYKDVPKSIIITSGGKGQLKNISDAPNLSSMLKNELKNLGVPESSIVEENNSANTYQQLFELIDIIRKYKPDTIFIVSNGWHLPRIQAMLNYSKKLRGLKKYSIKLVSSEEVAIKHNPERWKKYIDSAMQSPPMKKRIELEIRGIEDIKKGKYKFQ